MPTTRHFLQLDCSGNKNLPAFHGSPTAPFPNRTIFAGMLKQNRDGYSAIPNRFVPGLSREFAAELTMENRPEPFSRHPHLRDVLTSVYKERHCLTDNAPIYWLHNESL